jgi:NAD+--asparagine ADP-ribosyltransferase
VKGLERENAALDKNTNFLQGSQKQLDSAKSELENQNKSLREAAEKFKGQ